MVDRSRGEKLVVNLDISFPRVPCYRWVYSFVQSLREETDSLVRMIWVISVECGYNGYFRWTSKWYTFPSPSLFPPNRAKTDWERGANVPDVNHDLLKTRLGADGKPIESVSKGKELTGDAERIARQKSEGYCQSLSLSLSLCRLFPPSDGALIGKKDEFFRWYLLWRYTTYWWTKSGML